MRWLGARGGGLDVVGGYVRDEESAAPATHSVGGGGQKRRKLPKSCTPPHTRGRVNMRRVSPFGFRRGDWGGDSAFGFKLEGGGIGVTNYLRVEA